MTRRDDPRVLECVERLLREGKRQSVVAREVDALLDVDLPWQQVQA